MVVQAQGAIFTASLGIHSRLVGQRLGMGASLALGSLRLRAFCMFGVDGSLSALLLR